MEMQIGQDTPAPRPGQSDALTFHGLHSRVQGLRNQSIYPKAGVIEKWSYRVGVAAALIGLVSALMLDRWIPGSVLLPLALACLVVEIGGFLVGGFLSLRREYRQYSQPRLSHAMEMDNDFLHWQSVVDELCMFPREDREQRLRYVSALRTRMTERMGILYGGLQRLGPFPLLIALYL